MRYLWIVSRQFTAKVFAHRLVLKQKLVMVSFQSEITEVPAGCIETIDLETRPLRFVAATRFSKSVIETNAFLSSFNTRVNTEAWCVYVFMWK